MGRALVVEQPAPIASLPLRLVERPQPEVGAGMLLVDVEVCGVCRTDLHVVEGDLSPRRPSVVPGHEVVGRVAACGAGVRPMAHPATANWFGDTSGALTRRAPNPVRSPAALWRLAPYCVSSIV